MALDPRVLENLRDGREFARYSREQMRGGQNPITAAIPTSSPETAPTTTATEPEGVRFGNVGMGQRPMTQAVRTPGPDATFTRLRPTEPEAEPQNWGSISRGLARLKSGAALLMQEQGWLSDEQTTAYLIDQAEVLRQNPMPEDSALLLETLSASKTMGDFIGATLTNIEDVPGAFASVLGESAVQAGAVLGGAAAGGLAGSAVAPGPGTLTGLIGGAGLGSYITNMPVEVMSAWQEAAAEAGYDLNSVEDLQRAMGDEEVIDTAKAYANRRAIPIAAFDAMSMGVAGRIGAPVAKIVGGGARGRTAGLLAELGAQAGAGAGGEAGAQYASEGRITSPGEVMLEGGVEFFFGVPEVAVGSAFGGRGSQVAPRPRVEDTEIYGGEEGGEGGEGGEPPPEGPAGEPGGLPQAPELPQGEQPDLPLFNRPERTEASQPGVYRNADPRTGQTDLFGTTALGTAPPRPLVGEQFSFDLQEGQGNLGTSGLAREVEQTVENTYLPTPEDIFQAPTDTEAARLRDDVAVAADRISTAIDNIALMADTNNVETRRDIAAAERLLGTLNETLQDADAALGERRSISGAPRIGTQQPSGVQQRTTPREPGEVPLGPVTQGRGRQQLDLRLARRNVAAAIQRGRDAGEDVSALEVQLQDIENQLASDQTALERGEAPELPQGETARRLRFEQGEIDRREKQTKRPEPGEPGRVAKTIQDAREATRGLRVTARSPQGGEILSNLKQAVQNLQRQVISDFENTTQSGADETYGRAMDALYGLQQSLDRARTQGASGSVDAVGRMFTVAREAVRDLETDTQRNYSLGKIGEVLKAANPNRARAAAADAAAVATNAGAGRTITGETVIEPKIAQVDTTSGKLASKIIGGGNEDALTIVEGGGKVRSELSQEQEQSREDTEESRENAALPETNEAGEPLRAVMETARKREKAKRGPPLQRKDLEATEETPKANVVETLARKALPPRPGRPRKRPKWTEGMPPLRSLSAKKIAALSLGEKARYAMSLGMTSNQIAQTNDSSNEQIAALLTDVLQERAGRAVKEGTARRNEQLREKGPDRKLRSLKKRRAIIEEAKSLGIETHERKKIIDPTVRQRGVARKKFDFVPKPYAEIERLVFEARENDLRAKRAEKQARAGQAATRDDIVQQATEELTDKKKLEWAQWFNRAMAEGLSARHNGEWMTTEQLRNRVELHGKNPVQLRREVEISPDGQEVGFNRVIQPLDVVIVNVRTTQGNNLYKGAIVEKVPDKPGGNYEVAVDGPNNTTRTVLVKRTDIYVRREPVDTIEKVIPDVAKRIDRSTIRRAVGDSTRQDKLNRRFTQRVTDLSARRGEIALNEALDWIARNGPGRYRPLAVALRRLGLRVPVRLDTMAGLDAATGGQNTVGTYNDQTREVRVAMDAGNPIQALLHEAVHAATVSALANNPQLLAQVETLMERSKRLLEGSYGVSDASEFVTAAFTDPQFQRALEAQPARDTTNAWEAFKDVVRAVLRLVGIRLPRSLAQEVLALQPAMFETEQQIAARGPVTPGQSARIKPAEAIRQTNMIRRSLGNSTAMTNAATAAGALRSGVARWSTSQFVDNLKQFGLGMATLDQIVDMGKRLFSTGTGNALTQYARLMASKTAKTHRYQALSDAVNRAWANFQAANPEKNIILNRVMLNATLHSFDPDPKVRADFEAENAKRKAKGKKEIKVDAPVEIQRKLTADWKALGSEGQEIYRSVREELRKDWDTVTHQMKVNILRSFGVEDVDAVALAPTLKRKQDVMDLTPPEGEAGETWNSDLYNSLAPIFAKSRQDIYFPLRRFGNYVVVARSKGVERSGISEAEVDALRADASVKIVEQNEVEDGKYDVLFNREHISFFEDKGEARQWSEELKASGRYTEVSDPDIRRELNHYGEGMGNLNMILSRAEKAGLDERSRNLMRQVFIEWMPDTSFKKAELRRRKVAGADSDMRRGFAQYSRSAAYYKAQLEYGRDLANAVQDIHSAADNATGGDRLTMRMFANEIAKRDSADATFMSDPKWVQTLSDVGYAWYLISPSYWFVNSTQPALVTMPYLSSRYTARKSAAAMAKSYRAIMKYGLQTAGSERLGMKQLKDRLRTGVPGDDLFNIAENAKTRMVEAYGERYPQIEQMLNVLTDRGLVDLTFAMDLRDVIERGSDPEGTKGTSRVWAGVMDAGRTMPHLVEVINRMTTATAAYDLEMQKSGNHSKAVEEAATAVSQTQFNYGAENKPRYFTSRGLFGALTRPVLMFKQYAQHMYYLLGKHLYDATKGADKETRRVGRNTFMGILLSHSLVAGAAGGLMVEPVKWAFGLAQMLFEDDDEPWQLEQVIQSTIADMTNSPRVADAIMHGAPRLVGMDLSSRVNLNSLLFFDTYGATAEEQAQQQLLQAFGPLGNIYLNTASGWDRFSQGDFVGGMEKVVPKGLSDLFQAYGEATDGVLDTRGNVIVPAEELTPLDTFLTAMGLSPARVASTYEYRSAVNEQLYAVKNARSDLLRRFRQSDDRAAVIEEIQRFNRRHPRERITVDSLRRSLRTGMEREVATTRYGGVYMTPEEAASVSGLARVY